ncbi:MAG: ribonuclease P protein component [Candidatus Levybacteria bacterium]|nr:ribonuclease P protein component [Candidatus Levybacteria bacterium]
MFKRQNRLPRGVGFYNSNFFSTPFFVLKVKGNGLIVNRFGIVVSKKIDKRSTVRNKIKRIFRSILIDLNKDIISGQDMLFIVKKEILNKTNNKIDLQIRGVLEKARLINRLK